MQLGNFSVSLAVKDLGASHEFYKKLGFQVVHGEAAQNWLILQNKTTTIGLFQGMFEDNILTFNPGWDHQKNTLEGFTDIRTIQAELERQGIVLKTRADESTKGPSSLVVEDPDGNAILIDQHVDNPA